jgi:lysyl-tRNA synthetase class 2
MEMTEAMVAAVARELAPEGKVVFGGRELDFGKPWRRVRFFDALREKTGREFFGADERQVHAFAKELRVPVDKGAPASVVINEVFGELVEPDFQEPTFVYDYPKELSPLAKDHRSVSGLVERFEGYIGGFEVCNAFSELNDPLEQRRRFEAQMEDRARGDEEAQMLDEDYLRALEYGMPPAAGLGVGIDRLTMVFTDSHSIRDVILFPHMRPEDGR